MFANYPARQKVPGISAPQGKHYYDDLGQLIREDNRGRSASFVYEYDDAGNITSKKRYSFTTGTLCSAILATTYSYGDSSWRDLVTNITGFGTITYDEIGNPLTVGASSDGTGRYFTWTQGRQLSEYEFNYDASTHLRSQPSTLIQQNIMLKTHRVENRKSFRPYHLLIERSYIL